MASPLPTPAEQTPLWRAFNPWSVGIALGLGLVAAVALSPIFATPFPVLLGRTLFLAMVLLLVYVGAGRLLERLLPSRVPGWLRQTLQVIAVGLAAPLATLGAYLLSTGGDLGAFLGAPGRVLGFLWIAGVGVVTGLIITVGALLRERENAARAQALQFALERSQLEKQALDARLSLLQAQIEPHFLFNTLANVQALVESGSPRAAPVLTSLIAYLRAAMPRLQGGAPTLGDELALVRSYLELMQMRMPDRLQWHIDLPEALGARRFPPMALLTLVENAVRHGIDPAEDGGRIEVGGRSEPDGGVRLWVADTGVGMAPHAAPGTGLTNLRDRLAAYYGGRADLILSEAAASPPFGLRAEILLPPQATGQ
jgi:signal transduction histidine kinase